MRSLWLNSSIGISRSRLWTKFFMSCPVKYMIWLCFASQVAMATAAKAKLLLRELKTVKADLAFAKERCAQLEEENKLLRESREKGGNPADDDLVHIPFLLWSEDFFFLRRPLFLFAALIIRSIFFWSISSLMIYIIYFYFFKEVLGYWCSWVTATCRKAEVIAII